MHEIEKSGLTLVCIAGININDLKPGIPEMIELLKSAGINLRIVTGDNIVAATNVA